MSRFAPSMTGSAHPGTLLSALLAWLDARAHQAKFILRLEDLDQSRLRTGTVKSMIEALQWLGLDWDQLAVQSDSAERYEEALDFLAEQELLYPCCCRRREIRQRSVPAPGGGYVYKNTCRGRPLPVGGWKQSKEVLRVWLPDKQVRLVDESSGVLVQHPGKELGDPVVRRRDGVCAYHLASVVDDGYSGVTRIIRGHDLLTSTPTQILLQGLLGLPTPAYRHHLLLVEAAGQKLAKLHGSMPYEELNSRVSGKEMCGVLAECCGLRESCEPGTPSELLADFHWGQVHTHDIVFSEQHLTRL